MAGDGVPLVTELAHYGAGLALVVLLAALGIWGSLRGRTWGYLAAAFLILLAPSSSFVPIALEVIGDHRMYLPLACVIAALVLGMFEIVRRVAGEPAKALRGVLVLSGLAAATLGTIAHARNRVYASDLELWSDTALQRPGSARAQTNLGLALFARDRLDEALVCLREAIRLRPEYSEAHHDLGSVLMKKLDFAGAEKSFREALRLDPRAAASHHGLAEALLQEDQLAPAASEFEAALKLDPELPAAHVRLGAIYQTQGRDGEALLQYQEALRLDPRNVEVLNQLGILNAQSGRLDVAAELLRRALAIRPNFEDARANLEHVRQLQSGGGAPR
jgi:tetratricopeptide (TPR) repeat protein